MPLGRAVSRLVALQAQWAPSPYVALWARVNGFRKEALTDAFRDGSIVKAGSFRTTLHVMTRDDYPAIASSYAESQRGRIHVDIDALRDALGDEPFTSAEFFEIGHRVLGTDDHWTVAFAGRAVASVRTDPVGPWPHTKPSPHVVWQEALPDAQESVARVVRAYLAGYGPATREDIQQFTGFKLGQIDPALEGMRERDGYWDVPRAPGVSGDVPAPVRFLPGFDSIILAHRDRSRIVPPEYLEAVFNKKNGTTKNTFTVDGFVAGTWRVEKKGLIVEPFAPLPAKWKREVDAEGERLLAWWLG
jgi:hypothetical protein